MTYLVLQKCYEFIINTDVYFGEGILITSPWKLLQLKFTAASQSWSPL